MVWESQTEGFQFTITHTVTHSHTHTHSNTHNLFLMHSVSLPVYGKHSTVYVVNVTNKRQPLKWQLGKAKMIIDYLIEFLYVRVQETKVCNLNLSFQRVEVCIDGTTESKKVYSHQLQKCVTDNTYQKTFFLIIVFCPQVVLFVSTKDSRIIEKQKKERKNMR